MSQTLSPSSARCYGLARVARVWSVSRASVYRSLKETPPNTIARRPGPVGACSDLGLHTSPNVMRLRRVTYTAKHANIFLYNQSESSF